MRSICIACYLTCSSFASGHSDLTSTLQSSFEWPDSTCLITSSAQFSISCALIALPLAFISLDNTDFLIHQAIELVDELVDLLVRGVDLALDHFGRAHSSR